MVLLKSLWFPFASDWYGLVACISGCFQELSCIWQNLYFVGGSVKRYFGIIARAPCEVLITDLQFSRTFMVPATLQSDTLDLQLENAFSEGAWKGIWGKASCPVLVTDLLSWAKRRWLGTKQGRVTGGFISSPKWSQRGNFPLSEPGWPNHLWLQQWQRRPIRQWHTNALCNNFKQHILLKIAFSLDAFY